MQVSPAVKLYDGNAVKTESARYVALKACDTYPHIGGVSEFLKNSCKYADKDATGNDLPVFLKKIHTLTSRIRYLKLINKLNNIICQIDNLHELIVIYRIKL